MQQILAIAVAGALGTLSRYVLGSLVQQVGLGTWGTWVVNIVGCFLFGLIAALAERQIGIGDDLRLIILTGFMGAFTTFSSYIFEGGSLFRASAWFPALAYMGGQVVVGTGFLFLGMWASGHLGKLFS
jgi:CrcB protein